MISFASDYTQGAHPKILERLIETNLDHQPGYGEDEFCLHAKELIRETIGLPDAQIQFVSGGTQTNQLVIDSLLRSYEGVVAAQTGHVAVHEAGAIEFGGHKVLTLPQKNGKFNADDLYRFLEAFYADGDHDHMVFPGMVYLSYPTEYGTLYSKEELTEIHELCLHYDLPLFIDGARLGYGLASDKCDLTLAELARLCDVFYIGGTKVGALLGEAIVFPKGNMPAHFITIVKQHGALLAKGRLLGLQFETLFTDDLYLQISRHAIEMASYLKECFMEAGYPFLLNSPTNQQFVILKKDAAEKLARYVGFSVWEPVDETHIAVRFATSWATTREEIDELSRYL